MNHIGWCSRPPHKKDGFLRKGQFKKASNMNYCLDFSIRVEDELLRLVAERQQQTGQGDITIQEENELYKLAMDRIIAFDEGRTWASGNVRLGEIILLVDCDTRVVSARFPRRVNQANEHSRSTVCNWVHWRCMKVPRSPSFNTPVVSCKLCTTCLRTEVCYHRRLVFVAFK